MNIPRNNAATCLVKWKERICARVHFAKGDCTNLKQKDCTDYRTEVSFCRPIF